MPGISPIYDIEVWEEPVLKNKHDWRSQHLLETFTSILCSHLMCSCSTRAATDVLGSDNRIPIHSFWDISNMVRNLNVVLNVDCFIQLNNFSVIPSVKLT